MNEYEKERLKALERMREQEKEKLEEEKRLKAVLKQQIDELRAQETEVRCSVHRSLGITNTSVGPVLMVEQCYSILGNLP